MGYPYAGWCRWCFRAAPRVAWVGTGAASGYPDRVNVDGPSAPYQHGDDDRVVDVSDDGLVVLPEQTVDDTDRGWGEWSRTNDDRLLEDRPPHWD